jgi:hypothetical protein
MKHTKTPWRVGNPTGMGSVVADEPVPEIGGSNAIDYYGGHMIAESIAPRNAEFIVRACNAHELLVEALEDARELLALNGINSGDTADYGNGRASDIVGRIDAALIMARAA